MENQSQVDVALGLVELLGQSPEAVALLQAAVTAEWPAIRAGLRSQLRRRGVEPRDMGDAVSEASGWLWEALLEGKALGLAIWRAAARVAEGRRLVRQSDLERWGCEVVGSRDCLERMRLVVSGRDEVRQALPCACCGERRAEDDGRCGRCQRQAALVSLGAC